MKTNIPCGQLLAIKASVKARVSHRGNDFARLLAKFLLEADLTG